MSKKVDLTNKRFGKLVVLEKVYVKNKQSYWLCKCDCGNTRIVPIDSLTASKCKSCGCIRSNICKNEIRKRNKAFRDKNYIDNTSISQIKATFKNSTSGHKGVCWDKSNRCWRAYIYFKDKRYNLGNYKNIKLAIQARKDAEDKYFKPILEKYETD